MAKLTADQIIHVIKVTRDYYMDKSQWAGLRYNAYAENFYRAQVRALDNVLNMIATHEQEGEEDDD